MNKKNINILKNGGIGVIKTDTLYGILGSALNKKTVERIYEIKGRDKNKPFIILISSIRELEIFGIKIDHPTKKIIENYWPGKVSIILPIQIKFLAKFEYLHRGQKTLAFRLPKSVRLTSILKKTGPLVAPSANPQAEKPANSAAEAKKYFAEKIDFYEAGGKGINKPSKLIKITSRKVTILRD